GRRRTGEGRHQRRGHRRRHPDPPGLRHHRRVGGEDRSLRDRARGGKDRRLRRRDRRAPGRGMHVRPGRPGRARPRARHPRPAAPPADERPPQRGQDRRRGKARHPTHVEPSHARLRTTQRSVAPLYRKRNMSKKFLLPDLGEGLPDATIVEWYVKEGDTIKLDENLVSMETAKAVVDVPSPVSGKVLKLAGGPGDVIVTGTLLAEFEIDANLPQRAEGQDTGHHHGGGGHSVGSEDPAPDDKVVASDEGGAISDEGAPAPKGEARDDAGTVVGAMQSSDKVHTE